MSKFKFKIPLPWDKNCVAGVIEKALPDSTNAQLGETLNQKNPTKISPISKKNFLLQSTITDEELLGELKLQKSEIINLIVKVLENPEIELNIAEINLLKKMHLGRNGFADAFDQRVSLDLGRGDNTDKPDFYNYANIFLKVLRKNIALHRFSTQNLSGELQGKEKEVQDLRIKMFENPKIKLDENQLKLLKSMHKQQKFFRELYEEMNSFGAIDGNDKNHKIFNPLLHSESCEQYFLTMLINNITEETPQGHTIYSLGPKGSDGWQNLQVIVCNPITSTYLIIDGFLIDGKEEVYTQDISRYPDIVIKRRPPDPLSSTIMG